MSIRLIVGLGNPGEQYARTRHNVGFQTLDELAGRWNVVFRKGKWRSLVATGVVGGANVACVKPQTFMNDSGASVRGASDFYQLEPEEILVVHDDIDLTLGRLRLRERGGHGGHNGIRSIIHHLQTDAFPRLKIGVGRPPGQGASDHVLGAFRKHEVPIMAEAIERAASAVQTALADGLATAMNQYNSEPAERPHL